MRFSLVALVLQMRDVGLEHVEVLAVLALFVLGELLPACLLRLVRFPQLAVLLAELGVLLVHFGEAALQVAQFERLVAVFPVRGFEVPACVVVGLLEVAVVFFERLEGFGFRELEGRIGFCFW